jgi:hypothetical protein
VVRQCIMPPPAAGAGWSSKRSLVSRGGKLASGARLLTHLLAPGIQTTTTHRSELFPAFTPHFEGPGFDCLPEVFFRSSVDARLLRRW